MSRRDKRTTFVVGQQVGAQTLLECVYSGFWRMRCACGRERVTAIGPIAERVAEGLPGECKLCWGARMSEAAKARPHLCDTCGTKERARFGSTLKKRCMACDRRYWRELYAARAANGPRLPRAPLVVEKPDAPPGECGYVECHEPVRRTKAGRPLMYCSEEHKDRQADRWRRAREKAQGFRGAAAPVPESSLERAVGT